VHVLGSPHRRGFGVAPGRGAQPRAEKQAVGRHIPQVAGPHSDLEPVAQVGGGVDTQVARAASPGAAPADDLVGMLAAKDSFAANLSVFRRADEALGSLLDAVG